MTVARIINEKGRDVITASSGASIADIAATLAERRIGAVVIIEDDTLHGIVSERDVVRAIAAHGAAALAMPVSDWMTAKVRTCGPDETIDEVMQAMTNSRFRHLPVVHKGRLVGIVSIGDVVKRRIEDVQREADQIREYITTA
jgi:CBS domain-containing protein